MDRTDRGASTTAGSVMATNGAPNRARFTTGTRSPPEVGYSTTRQRSLHHAAPAPAAPQPETPPGLEPAEGASEVAAAQPAVASETQDAPVIERRPPKCRQDATFLRVDRSAYTMAKGGSRAPGRAGVERRRARWCRSAPRPLRPPRRIEVGEAVTGGPTHRQQSRRPPHRGPVRRRQEQALGPSRLTGPAQRGEVVDGQHRRASGPRHDVLGAVDHLSAGGLQDPSQAEVLPHPVGHLTPRRQRYDAHGPGGRQLGQAVPRGSGRRDDELDVGAAGERRGQLPRVATHATRSIDRLGDESHPQRSDRTTLHETPAERAAAPGPDPARTSLGPPTAGPRRVRGARVATTPSSIQK